MEVTDDKGEERDETLKWKPSGKAQESLLEKRQCGGMNKFVNIGQISS